MRRLIALESRKIELFTCAECGLRKLRSHAYGRTADMCRECHEKYVARSTRMYCELPKPTTIVEK